MVVPIGLEPTTSTMSRWHSTNWVTGPKRNGSISKKSLNSKQILIFRKIPPKFYTKISPRRKTSSKFCTKFTILPKLRVEFYLATKIRNPARIFIALVRYSRVSPQQPILPRFVLSSRFALPRLVSSTRLALPCLILLACPLCLEPVKTSKFFHSALEFLRFAASRLDPPWYPLRCGHWVSADPSSARNYRRREISRYKFYFA